MKRKQATLVVIGLLALPTLGQMRTKIADINKKIVGKWISADGKSYIEFLANGTCANGDLFPDGKWHISQNTLGTWPQGEDFSCGSGALTLIKPNVLSRDYGMGGEPEKFYRGAENLPKPVGALTVATARLILSQQINDTTVNNTMLTCHACYDPDDKADNDRANVVSTYSKPLTQFLIEHGYIRIDGDREVFTGKAKRSTFYGFNDGAPGLRFARFANPRLLAVTITNPQLVPIEFDLVPTEVASSFFSKAQVVRATASFSYQNESWSVRINFPN